jgi:hypothetical protein
VNYNAGVSRRGLEPVMGLFWKRLGAALLAVALLSGWQAALQHPLEHIDEHGDFVHVHDDGHSHEGESGSGPLCDALAALTACAPEALPVVAASDRAQPGVFFFHESAPRVAEPPPFLSQGPPASA